MGTFLHGRVELGLGTDGKPYQRARYAIGCALGRKGTEKMPIWEASDGRMHNDCAGIVVALAVLRNVIMGREN